MQRRAENIEPSGYESINGEATHMSVEQVNMALLIVAYGLFVYRILRRVRRSG